MLYLKEVAMTERKRERIEPNEGDVRFVRRNEKGQFDEVVDAGRSLSQDRKRDAKNADGALHAWDGVPGLRQATHRPLYSQLAVRKRYSAARTSHNARRPPVGDQPSGSMRTSMSTAPDDAAAVN